MRSRPIMSERDRQAVGQRLEDLEGEVTIRLFSQGAAGALLVPGRECPYCPQTEQLYRELVELSPKLHLEVLDFYTQAEEAQKYGVERIPCAVFVSERGGYFRFYGIPLGYEFATLLEVLISLSRGASSLRAENRERLRQVDQDVHIQVFVTPG